MITGGMMSSRIQEWSTPPSFFDPLDAEFLFTLDVCASRENAKCLRYFSRADDGLSRAWEGVCWMNPPYGRRVGDWIRKAAGSSLAGATVVALLPARTDTRWFHDLVLGREVRFIRGRIYFEAGPVRGRAPFPSMVVVFRPAGSGKGGTP